MSMGAFWSQYLLPLWLLLGPLVVIIGGLSLLASFAIARSTKITFRSALANISAYAWLGAVCGFIAGASQEALIGTLLTSTLGLVTALLTYLSAGKIDDERSKAIPLAIVLLCVSSLIGLSIGRSYRMPWDDYQEKRVAWKAQLDEVDIPVLKAKKQYLQCKELMTPPATQCNEILTR